MKRKRCTLGLIHSSGISDGIKHIVYYRMVNIIPRVLEEHVGPKLHFNPMKQYDLVIPLKLHGINAGLVRYHSNRFSLVYNGITFSDYYIINTSIGHERMIYVMALFE